MNYEEVSVLARGLKEFQLSSGLVLQTMDGVGDPWNHVEVLMALTVVGEVDAAQRGYRWLAERQLGDGAWFHYYREQYVHSARIDFNVIAYCATGLLHYLRSTQDLPFVKEFWPTVRRAIKLVDDHMDSSGYLPWSINGRGQSASFSLLTGSSSLLHSLHAANELALEMGEPPLFPLAKGASLKHRIGLHPDSFADKSEFAMDSYYPALCGARPFTPGERTKFEEGFLVSGFGVKCVYGSEWVTTAETSEYAITLLRSGDEMAARETLAHLEQMRSPSGLYFTGIGHQSGRTFPANEVSSYSNAAVVLAWDALEGYSGGADIFSRPNLWPENYVCEIC